MLLFLSLSFEFLNPSILSFIFIQVKQCCNCVKCYKCCNPWKHSLISIQFQHDRISNAMFRPVQVWTKFLNKQNFKIESEFSFISLSSLVEMNSCNKIMYLKEWMNSVWNLEAFKLVPKSELCLKGLWWI